eukprot:474993-Pelagomonas_calceolata.AAC.1
MKSLRRDALLGGTNGVEIAYLKLLAFLDRCPLCQQRKATLALARNRRALTTMGTCSFQAKRIGTFNTQQLQGDTLAQKSLESPPLRSYNKKILMGIWRVIGITQLHNLAARSILVFNSTPS